MLVSDNTRNEYHNTSIHKTLTLTFPDIPLNLTNSDIYQETMSLRESILENDSIEFVGCISSIFEVEIQNFENDLKGQRIMAVITTDNSADEPITLFNGIVDSAMMQSNKRSKKITAYDQLYTKGLIDVSGWYNGLEFPLTIKDIRYSLFSFVGIDQELEVLPNDGLEITKQYDPQSLQALNVIKAICQINGAFGIVNRLNRFEYRILQNLSDTSMYPAEILFPSNSIFPFDPHEILQEMETESFGFYRTVNFEEYEVKPVEKLTIRQTEDSPGVSYGTGENNYIIQGNMFTYGLDNVTLSGVAERIYSNVKGIYYHPFESENNGLPYIECGVDAVSYAMYDFVTPENSAIRNFYVFGRELNGIQALSDSYSATGSEYQIEFITDLQTQIDFIKQNVKDEVESVISDYDFTEEFSDYTYDSSTLDEKFEEVSSRQIKLESVAELPENPDPDTWYFIQGEVIVT